jgi:hypothetical protein
MCRCDFGSLYFAVEKGGRLSTPPNHARGCVKSADMNFGNDQIFDMESFDETGRRIEWSKNEFSHRLALQATREGVSSSAVADHAISPACLSSGR